MRDSVNDLAGPLRNSCRLQNWWRRREKLISKVTIVILLSLSAVIYMDYEMMFTNKLLE